MNSTPPASESRSRQPSNSRTLVREHLGWALSLFLVILGAKLWLIHQAATSLPLLDQWDGEGADIFLPWLQGNLSFADLVRGHNEHRILFTRLLDLALLQLNHRWDNLLEVVVNAILHAATLTVFGCSMAQLLGRLCWPIIWMALALVSVPPFAWENTLWGFQSQFYFLLLFSLLAMVLLIRSQPLTGGWWLGMTAGVAALFTMASGFLAVAAVIAVLALEKFKSRAPWRSLPLATLAGCALILASGILLKPSVLQHQVLQAHSPAAFLAAFGKNLAWPLSAWPAFALCNLVPVIVLAWLYLRSRASDLGPEKIVLGLAIWVGLQALAAAYARGADGRPPPSRYMDLSSFTLVAGCLASGIILTRHHARLLFRVGLGVWFVACLVGLWLLTDHAVRVEIPKQRVDQGRLVQSTREFMITGSHTALERPDLQIPPLARLLAVLRAPEIRGILPPCVQPGPESPGNSWLSDRAADLAAAWKSLLALGLACLFLNLLAQNLARRGS
jgi:hypothetical protein